MESPVLTIPETAEYLRLSRDTIYVLVRAKAFPAVKIGGTWRILKEELNKWLVEQYDNKLENL